MINLIQLKLIREFIILVISFVFLLSSLHLVFYFSVQKHFMDAHKQSIEMWDIFASKRINKCQICYRGPFLEFDDLLNHLAYNERYDHFIYVDIFMEQLGLEMSLKPILSQTPTEPAALVTPAGDFTPSDVQTSDISKASIPSLDVKSEYPVFSPHFKDTSVPTAPTAPVTPAGDFTPPDISKASIPSHLIVKAFDFLPHVKDISVPATPITPAGDFTPPDINGASIPSLLNVKAFDFSPYVKDISVPAAPVTPSVVRTPYNSNASIPFFLDIGVPAPVTPAGDFTTGVSAPFTPSAVVQTPYDSKACIPFYLDTGVPAPFAPAAGDLTPSDVQIRDTSDCISSKKNVQFQNYYDAATKIWSKTVKLPYKIPSIDDPKLQMPKVFMKKGNKMVFESQDEWTDNFHPMWEEFRENAKKDKQLAAFIHKKWDSSASIDVTRNLTKFSKMCQNNIEKSDSNPNQGCLIHFYRFKSLRFTIFLEKR